MRFLRHPVAQYVAAGVLMLVVIAGALSWLSGRAATTEARTEARRTTELLGRTVVQPAVQRGLVQLDAGAIDRFNRRVRDALRTADVVRVKLWRSDGTVVYSDQSELIGQQFALGAAERAVLEGAPTEAEISDLARRENRNERDQGGLLEVYTAIESPEGDPLLFEAYYSLRGVDDRRTALLRAFRPITIAGLLVFLAATTPLLALLTRRLELAAAEREQLLLLAAEASDAERRRIARDLHDGVVQDLAATAFSLSAAARDAEAPDSWRARLESAGASLRDSLRALRSLLVEIHPPDLRAEGLVAALEDLVASAPASGVRATVSAADVDGLTGRDAALIWRVAQEAVRNCLRHAAATRLEITVAREGDGHVLTVRDDGRGFDPQRTTTPDHFGLRGLESLARDGDAALTVRSAPGAGTLIQLRVSS
ncbi:MAG TPA: sensor histidine kinase [Nocardioidaceae bacterium]|nr:sensor histidine kinase [Nocardioidaceae bacterium]